MLARRDYLRSKPFVALGWYQYLVASRDPAAQAREFIATVGSLRPNEFPILDLEEGSGDQTQRAETWFKVVDAWARFQASLYSGKSFIDNQLGGPGRWGQRPLWIADYPSSYTANPALEPKRADWWQYTNRARFPGIPGGVDGSIFHGTAQQFLTRVKPGAPPSPHPITEEDMVTAVVKQNGAIEVFVEKSSGEVFHTWQNGPNTSWWGAEAGKRNAAWQSLGTPGK